MGKSKARDTKGRVCGVCIAGLVSGIASGKIVLGGKKRGRSGGADAPIYRAQFDRPRGLSPSGYDALVKLEGGALTQAQIREAMLRWNVGAKVFERASGKALWSLVVMPDGRVVVETDWIKVRREQEESALRGPPPKKGRSGSSVADGILEQLGGRKFLAMTGAKQLMSFDTPGYGGLQFKLPKSGARAKLGIDAVRITLEDSDTYTMRFYKGMQEVRAIGALYSDNLRQAFTSVTGLETSLGSLGQSGGRTRGRCGRVGGIKKEPEEAKTWGVFPFTPDSSPSAGAPVPDAAHGGYVVREANRETGKGTYWPYSQVQAVKLYWRRHLADRHSSELTFGRGSKR